MTKDPAAALNLVTVHWPPSRGPGSGKDAWVAFATETAEGNRVAWATVDAQSSLIASLEAEVAQLRARLAQRKPKGGRPKVSDLRAALVRADLAAGLSQRQAAARNGVSPMTVSRLARWAQNFPTSERSAVPL